MLVKKERYLNSCSFNGCDNLAEVLIINENTKDEPQKFYLCEKCAQELNEKLAVLFVPKTIKSKYTSQEKI